MAGENERSGVMRWVVNAAKGLADSAVETLARAGDAAAPGVVDARKQVLGGTGASPATFREKPPETKNEAAMHRLTAPSVQSDTTTKPDASNNTPSNSDVLRR